ncbi:GDSL esterase/lipase [Gossypium australe]|uniref:GDSL esterase/lipase n=1 Tax=Gossypium australe TaxID=47621 RepID=A0A5B6UU93_9ROSI|nr:GDSL esterase/lipase [Gossypium australe]
MRPDIVLFGDSITQESFRSGGWGASLADAYSRKADVVLRGYGGYNTRWALFLLHHLFPLGSTKPPVATTIFFGANDAALAGRTSERQHVPVEEYKENLRKIVRHLKVNFFISSLYFLSNQLSRAVHNSRFNLTDLSNKAQAANKFVENHNNNGIELTNGRAVVNEITSGRATECSPTMLIVLITPPPINEEGRMEYARETYGEKAMTLPERTNETTGVYAKGCVELAGELGVRSINLWSKMQETDGWQKKYLRDGLHLTAEGNAVVFEEVVNVFKEAWLDASEMPYDFPHHSEIDGKNPEKAFQQKCL